MLVLLVGGIVVMHGLGSHGNPGPFEPVAEAHDGAEGHHPRGAAPVGAVVASCIALAAVIVTVGGLRRPGATARIGCRPPAELEPTGAPAHRFRLPDPPWARADVMRC